MISAASDSCDRIPHDITAFLVKILRFPDAIATLEGMAFHPLEGPQFSSYFIQTSLGRWGHRNSATPQKPAWFPRATPNAKSPCFMFGCNPKNSENWVLTLPILGGPPSLCFFSGFVFYLFWLFARNGYISNFMVRRGSEMRFYQVETCHLVIVGSTSLLPFSILHGFCLPCH